MKNKDCLVIAHRGASHYMPENTLHAFDLALKIGVDYLEFDVQLTKDQVPVIFHDSDLSNKTDIKGNIQDYCYEEIRNLDVGKWFGEKYKGTKLVTLDTVLRYYGNQFKYFIEIKNPTQNIEQILFDMLKKYQINLTNDQVVIQSFNQACLLTVREKYPDIPINQLILKKKEEEMPFSFEEMHQYADGVGINQSNIDKQFIEKARQNDLKVYPYTVNDPAMMDKFLGIKVDGIITDRPDVLKKHKL